MTEAGLRSQSFYRDLPDEDLMDHVVAGSQPAFACLVDRYKNRLQNVVFREAERWLKQHSSLLA